MKTNKQTPRKSPDELTSDERADILLELEKEDDIIDDEAFDFDMGFDTEWDMDGELNKDVNLVEDKELEQSRWRIIAPAVKSNTVKFARAIDLARHIKPSAEGFRYDCIVGGNFIFGDFLEAFMRIHNIRVDELLISTLSFSQENVDSLKLLKDFGYFKHLTMCTSVYFFSHERGGLVPYFHDVLGDCATMAIASIHTKTIQFRLSDGRKVVIHGSANLRSSGNVEQFTVETNAELFDFFAEIFERIKSKYEATDRTKKLRIKGTWDAITNN